MASFHEAAMNSGPLRPRLAAMFRPTNIIGTIAVLAVLGSAIFADAQNRLVGEQQLRASVSRELNVARASLETNLDGDLQLIRGLSGTLATEPDMDEAHFTQLASEILGERSRIRLVTASSPSGVRLVFPGRGNEKLIGRADPLDLGASAAVQASTSDVATITGPMPISVGREAFVFHVPITVVTPEARTTWGVVSAAVDTELLYSQSSLTGGDANIEVAISRPSVSGDKVFFGDPAIFSDRPAIADVSVLGGFWEMAARPAGGWEAQLPNPWPFRFWLALAAALIIGPLALARHLINERARNISALAERQNQLDVLSRRLGLALDVSEVGVWEFNLDTGNAVWDERMNELFGLPRDGGTRTDTHWRNAVHPDDLAGVQAQIDAAVGTHGRYICEYRIRRPDASERTIRAIGSCYRDADGSWRLVGCNWDVTEDVAIRQDLERAKALAEAHNAELMAATARIEHTSLHDALTQLPNRRYLDRVLEERAAACHRDNSGLALLHIDLDRFKQINDTLGHAAGDAMLVHAAAVLRANVQDGDFVARIGGDEFVIVAGTSGRRELGRLASRIVEDMRQPLQYQGHECRSGVSIGIAFQHGAKANDKRLLIDADIALYRAKRRGRNRHEFFTAALQAEIVSTKQMADDILCGIEQGQFVAWFQPQFDARTLAISGVEALARWEHPERGIVSPGEFLPIAEDLNVVATIDRMILDQTLAHMTVWREKGLNVPHASVNVSARRLRDEGLIRSVRKLDIAPGTIAFELVESIYLDESEDVVAFNIDQLRELGIDIEIDDFGTGYASIVSLLKLKPSRLKIDRQLMMPVTESKGQQALIASIVDIGHSLGIGVVAEGVETDEHAHIATALRCDALQGYAFSKPLPGADFQTFVADWEAEHGLHAA